MGLFTHTLTQTRKCIQRRVVREENGESGSERSESLHFEILFKANMNIISFTFLLETVYYIRSFDF